MSDLGFADIGKTVANWMREQELAKKAAADKENFGRFSAGATKYLRGRAAPNNNAVLPVAAQEEPDPFDLEAIAAQDSAGGIPFPDAEGQTSAPAPVKIAPGGPGTNADELLGLADVAALYDLNAQHPSTSNAATLKNIVDIWQAKDKPITDAMLEGKRHGYRAEEINQRNKGSLDVANIRARAAERAARLRQADHEDNLEVMLDHYTDELAKVKREADEWDTKVPIPADPEMAAMGMDKVWNENVKIHQTQARAFDREILQIRNKMADAMRKGAKPAGAAGRAPAQPAPVGRPGDAMGLY